MEYTSTDFTYLSNITKKTLRHYHKIALLSPSKIDTNGYWYYNDESLNTIQLIKNLQLSGFSLNEIKENLKTDC